MLSTLEHYGEFLGGKTENKMISIKISKITSILKKGYMGDKRGTGGCHITSEMLEECL